MKKQNRLKAYLMVVIFLVPMLGAYALYFFREHFEFTSMRNGELITPPLSLQAVFPNFETAGKWQLISLRPEHCDALCEEQLHLLNNAYIGLGKDQHRVIKRTLKMQDAPLSLQQKNILIVDPKGWIILYYTFPFNPKGIFEDLRRLLKYSHAG